MRVKFVPMSVKHDWKFVQPMIGVKLCEDTKGIIAVDVESNAPVAVCVMDSFTHTAVQIHFMIVRKMVLRHGFLEEIADYVFNQCGKELMIGLVPSDNEASLKMCARIGFTETYRVKDGFNHGVDYVVFEMRKTECPWLEHTIAEVHHGGG